MQRFTVFALVLMLIAMPCHAATFSERVQKPNPARKMPPLVFEDADGAQHSVSEFHGPYILLNIWATWCAPCVREMPSLDTLQKLLGIKKLHIIALSEDRGDVVVTSFYKTHGIKNLAIAIDHAGTAPSVLHLEGLPTTLLIDPQGNEIARLEGDADWASPEVVAYLQREMH